MFVLAVGGDVFLSDKIPETVAHHLFPQSDGGAIAVAAWCLLISRSSPRCRSSLRRYHGCWVLYRRRVYFRRCAQVLRILRTHVRRRDMSRRENATACANQPCRRVVSRSDLLDAPRLPCQCSNAAGATLKTSGRCGLSFKVQEGEVVAFSGRNGAGKSKRCSDRLLASRVAQHRQIDSTVRPIRQPARSRIRLSTPRFPAAKRLPQRRHSRHDRRGISPASLTPSSAFSEIDVSNRHSPQALLETHVHETRVRGRQHWKPKS